MSEIDQILAHLPMNQIAEQLGVDEAEAEAATREALPALLGGLQANIADEDGALSLGQALEQHDPGLLGSDLSDIDMADGEKIVGHILGDGRTDVIAQLGGSRPGGSGMIGKLLPILAPILLSYLAGKLRDRGGLGGVLGDVVGGAAGQGGAAGRPGGSASGGAGDGGLGDILGGVLGGGGAGGGLGDILGQVLGGGQGGPGAAGGAGSASGMPGGDELPEQPTGPLIPTDGSEPADVTRGGQSGGGAGGGALGGVLGDILGQVLGGGRR